MANRTGDLFVASAQPRITQVGACLREIVEGIRASGSRSAKPSQLRKDVPDPVARLPTTANFRQGRFIADRGASLSVVKPCKRHTYETETKTVTYLRSNKHHRFAQALNCVYIRINMESISGCSIVD